MTLVNQRIWIEDEEYIYLPGKVIGREDNQLKVEVWIDSKKQIRLKKDNKDEIKEVYDLNCPDDLTTLKEITQEYLLYILRRRFQMNNSLTTIGKQLALWVNHCKLTQPFKCNENDLNLLREFCMSILKEESKRKNTINASLSLSQFQSQFHTHTNINEAIVLFGQTNSGKTLLANNIINTFLEMSNDTSSLNQEFPCDNHKDMINQSIQILRSFNQCGQSSKSCLVINLNYDMTNEYIVSCKFIPYILLTNSLTSKNKEGIFNIFYTLIGTMIDNDKPLFLHKPKAYFNYLSNEANTNNTLINYDQLKSFIKSLSISDEHINAFISILMSILYLGNIQFMIDQSNKEVDINPHSKEDLKAISTLLSIDYTELKKILTQCKTTSDASSLRNKVVHLLYLKATDWLYNQINHYFNEREKDYSSQVNHYQEKKKTISVFDTIGYRNHPFNSIDDFIVNYSNEKIIELFNKKMLVIEQEEYKRESIQWKEIEHFDNEEVLKLFESKGLIDLLDESTARTVNLQNNKEEYNGDKEFYNQVYQSYSNSIALGVKSNDFITINHSFGDVHYYTNGFIDRNIKIIPKEVYLCFESSKNYSINQILNYNKTTTSSESLIKMYKKKIDEFIIILSHSNLRFIHCLSSNTNSIKNHNKEFKSSIVHSQLLTSNIPQIVSFIKTRYSVKLTFDSFVKKFGYISNNMLPLLKRIHILNNDSSPARRKTNRKSSINTKSIIIDIITILKQNKQLKKSLSNIQIGLTTVYLNDTATNELNTIIKNLHHIKTLQRNITKWTRLHIKAQRIQRAYRQFRKQKQMKLLNEAKERNKANTSRVKSLSAQKVRHRNVIDILKKEQSSLVEAELLQMVKNYQEEINLLREVHIENEQLRKKNAALQLQVASIETDCEKEKKKERDSVIAPRNSTSKSALALLTEVSALKKKIKEYEIKLETQIISIQHNEHIISDLKQLNETLQDQIAKRSQNDFNELNQLMEKISVLENEKREYQEKMQSLNSDIDYNSIMWSSVRGSNEKDQMKSISESKKVLLSVKSELKQSKFAYNELKALYDIEVNKSQALTDKLHQKHKLKSQLASIVIIPESRFSLSNSNTGPLQKELKAKEKEIASLKEQLVLSIEKQEQKTETYQKQLMLSSKELQKKQEYINQLHNSLDIHMESSIQRRKEIFDMKNKETASMQSVIEHDSDVIKRREEEINQLRELVEQKQKAYEDSCISLKHKKKIIRKKKEENDLLVLLFKNKKSELQCVEALKYANSTSIKEKLLNVQEEEKELIRKVEELANGSDYSDEENSEDEKDNRSSEIGSIASFHSLEDNEDNNNG